MVDCIFLAQEKLCLKVVMAHNLHCMYVYVVIAMQMYLWSVDSQAPWSKTHDHRLGSVPEL